MYYMHYKLFGMIMMYIYIICITNCSVYDYDVYRYIYAHNIQISNYYMPG